MSRQEPIDQGCRERNDGLLRYAVLNEVVTETFGGKKNRAGISGTKVYPTGGDQRRRDLTTATERSAVA